MSNIRHRGSRGPASVPATEAAKTFGRLVDRVREERATYVIERGGKPVAQITPIARPPFTFAAFKALAAALPNTDREFVTALERVTARHNRPRLRDNPWER